MLGKPISVIGVASAPVSEPDDSEDSRAQAWETTTYFKRQTAAQG
jgi:hypothetical protein